jgi:hypothetical protein
MGYLGVDWVMVGVGSGEKGVGCVGWVGLGWVEWVDGLGEEG